jgi:hypothetical protein
MLNPEVKTKKILAIKLEMQREVKIRKKMNELRLRSRYLANSKIKYAVMVLEKP